jgi:glycerophosphoryl diester phosphodiesterase
MLEKLLILCCFTIPYGCYSQSVSHENAHAHNDYEHQRPLYNALENGFTSIEADVHLKNGELLVAHNVVSRNAKTLEALYLKPLDSISRQNGGRIYPQREEPIVLLIDIKTAADPTYQAIIDILSKYRDCLNTPTRSGALQLIISGNRPIELIRGDPQHLTAIDGRPEDLGKGFTTSEMPWISESYSKIIAWKGDGEMPEEELIRVRNLAQRVHQQNKVLRLWAIPDNEITWKALLKAGVDVINTDKLEDLNNFLSNRKI